MSRRRNEVLRARIRWLHARGVSVRKIAHKVGRSPTRVFGLLREDHHKEKS
jgi:IS30 family transposase